MFPKNDEQFEEKKIGKVENLKNGEYAITFEEGWNFLVPKNPQVIPEVGMVARLYGNGIGFRVRGLFLNDIKIFYRTEEEDKEYNEIQTFGADATEWLRRWDEGRTVWSISMGGLGPGYEQCIQIVCAEVLRFVLEKKYDVKRWDTKELWAQDRKEIEDMSFKNPIVEKLGITGAQWGAALNLALCFYRNGPRVVMKDEKVKDRHIQVSRSFPSV